MVEAAPPAVYAKQGEVVGKTKGRKKKASKGQPAADEQQHKRKVGAGSSAVSPKKAKMVAKPPVSSSVPDSHTPDAPEPEGAPKPKAKACRKRKSKCDDPAAESRKPAREELPVPALESLTSPFKPPAHIQTWHVYSNSYRKSLAGGLEAEEARKQARLATALFKAYGVVTSDLCGKFADKPRKKKPAEENAEAGEMPAPDGSVNST